MKELKFSNVGASIFRIRNPESSSKNPESGIGSGIQDPLTNDPESSLWKYWITEDSVSFLRFPYFGRYLWDFGGEMMRRILTIVNITELSNTYYVPTDRITVTHVQPR